MSPGRPEARPIQGQAAHPQHEELMLHDLLCRLYEAAWARSRAPESAEPPAL